MLAFTPRGVDVCSISPNKVLPFESKVPLRLPFCTQGVASLAFLYPRCRFACLLYPRCRFACLFVPKVSLRLPWAILSCPFRAFLFYGFTFKLHGTLCPFPLRGRGHFIIFSSVLLLAQCLSSGQVRESSHSLMSCDSPKPFVSMRSKAMPASTR